MSEPARPRHRIVLAALNALDADFLAQARCFFGGGTRIVLGLDEYRESADIDFLCSSREGYRDLRGTVSDTSLGRIAKPGLKLAREVIADRYGIRTFVETAGEKLKLEIILEGRIGLAGGRADGLPVAALDPASCCAEKFLANADRWGDESAMGRDVIDLAFMASGWAGSRCAPGSKPRPKPTARPRRETRSARRRGCSSSPNGAGAVFRR